MQISKLRYRGSGFRDQFFTEPRHLTPASIILLFDFLEGFRMTAKIKYLMICAISMIMFTSYPSIGLQSASVKQGQIDLLPHLEKKGSATQLFVDGKPFLALAGELQNSSSSSLEYMKPVWPKLTSMNLNTVLAVVSWDLIETQEGKYDFKIVDGLIQQARRHDLRLVILWFGSWKNGISHYVPGWVKKDSQRFPRVRIENGKNIEVLSTFSGTNWQADARAFAALMRHIREVDSKKHTVVMIQVENEVGILGDSRDRCDAANAAFSGPVPKELMSYLQRHKDTLLPELRKIWETAGFKTSGTYEEVFGKGAATDEIFMAWNYAGYVDRVSQAGKAEYPLPMYVNAWIIQPEDKKPGDYPSGGPQAHNHDIWRAGAPQIDILAPDIYLPNFVEICAMYTRNGNPLFIPESRAGASGAANLFYAVGHHNAICYSPFAIESRITDPVNDPLVKGYKVLSQLVPLILEYQGTDKIEGIILGKESTAQKLQLGSYMLEVDRRHQRRTTIVPDLGYGIIISIGPDEYIVAGSDIQITFFPDSGTELVGLDSVYEGTYVKGCWIPGRKLNGDEIMLNYHLDQMAAGNRTGSVLRLPGDGPAIRRVKLYRF
jgi:hypothetical protein